MNKSFKLILLLSLAANALWLLAAVTGYLSPRKPPAARAPATALPPKPDKEIAAMLSTNDPASLRDQLRNLGLPDELIRSIVAERIASGYDARRQEIFKDALERARQRPYWRHTNAKGWWNSTTLEQQRKIIDLGRDQQNQLRQILGDDETAAFSRRRLSFLPADKAIQLQNLKSDYEALKQQVLYEMSGFRMPDDIAKARLLLEEKQRDIQALLTPDERAMNELQDSNAARSLQSKFAGFDLTEEEYKALHAAQSAFDEKFGHDDMAWTGKANAMQSLVGLHEAMQELDAQFKTALGDERYAEYQLVKRNDYQTLLAAQQRFNLPSETVSQTYQVRETTASEAARISADTTLDPAQKTQAYAALAAQATAQIRATLGDDIGDAYIANALPWLKKLPKAATVTVHDYGYVEVTPPKSPPRNPPLQSSNH